MFQLFLRFFPTKIPTFFKSCFLIIGEIFLYFLCKFVMHFYSYSLSKIQTGMMSVRLSVRSSVPGFLLFREYTYQFCGSFRLFSWGVGHPPPPKKHPPHFLNLCIPQICAVASGGVYLFVFQVGTYFLLPLEARSETPSIEYRGRTIKFNY